MPAEPSAPAPAAESDDSDPDEPDCRWVGPESPAALSLPPPVRPAPSAVTPEGATPPPIPASQSSPTFPVIPNQPRSNGSASTGLGFDPSSSVEDNHSFNNRARGPDSGRSRNDPQSVFALLANGSLEDADKAVPSPDVVPANAKRGPTVPRSQIGQPNSDNPPNCPSNTLNVSDGDSRASNRDNPSGLR